MSAPNSNSKCKGCNKMVKGNDTKICSVCTGHYHYQCLGITPENFNKESKQSKLLWKCPDCKGSEKRGDNTNTPVRQQSQQNLPVDTGNMSESAMDDLKSYFDIKLKEATSTILSHVKEQIMLENKATQKVIEEIKCSLNFVCSQYEDLSMAIKEKSQSIESLQAQNEALQSQIEAVSTQCNSMEQQARICNIEIQCVPEDRNENLLTTIKQLGKVVARELADGEIVNFHRVPKMNQESNRPRAIVAKFTSPRVRDEVLAAVKNFNKIRDGSKLHSGHLGISGDKQPIYVSEHLSPANKKLHAAARAVAKEKQYEFVWIRNGKIYVRKNMMSKAVVIPNIDAIKRL